MMTDRESALIAKVNRRFPDRYHESRWGRQICAYCEAGGETAAEVNHYAHCPALNRSNLTDGLPVDADRGRIRRLEELGEKMAQAGHAKHVTEAELLQGLCPLCTAVRKWREFLALTEADVPK